MHRSSATAYNVGTRIKGHRYDYSFCGLGDRDLSVPETLGLLLATVQQRPVSLPSVSISNKHGYGIAIMNLLEVRVCV